VRWLLATLAVLPMACGAGPGPEDDVAPDAADTEMSVDVADVGELVLGTHPAGISEPGEFRPLADGDALNVELGFQGLWMVVLAFKTRDLYGAGEPLFLTGELVVDGQSQGTLSLTDQKTTDGGDGWAYYFNFFLVVDDSRIGGRPGQVRFTARDGAGRLREVTLDVDLTGGE